MNLDQRGYIWRDIPSFYIPKRPKEGEQLKTLETNDWMILNNIIYKIYTTEDLDFMRQQLLEQLKLVLDFDSADFYLVSQDEGRHLIKPVTYNCEEEMLDYEGLEDGKGITYTGKSIIYRETDLVSEEEWMKKEYYNKVYRPNNWHYSLHMVLGHNKDFLGVITFYRTIGKENFQYDDIFVMDMLKDHIAYRLYRDNKEHESAPEKLSVTEVTEKYELTKREHTILKMLLDGKDNEVICAELKISVNTIKKHILNIYRKLGIKNRVQMFKMIKEKE